MENKIKDILEYYKREKINEETAIRLLLNLHNVSEMFDFAGYLYGNFDYHDNTEEGDIYVHNDNGLKYTREKVHQQWLGIRNSR